MGQLREETRISAVQSLDIISMISGIHAQSTINDRMDFLDASLL